MSFSVGYKCLRALKQCCRPSQTRSLRPLINSPSHVFLPRCVCVERNKMMDEEMIDREITDG